MKNLRRDFIKRTSLLAFAGVMGADWLLARTSPIKTKRVGLQLYSLRDDIKGGVQPVLEKVAEMGYKSLELANYQDGEIYGMRPVDFKKAVAALGLDVTSAHVGGPKEYSKRTHSQAMDWWTRAIEDHAEAGASFIVKPSMPFLNTLEELKLWCDYYNKVGEIAKASGLLYGFHNHAREFNKVEGKIMYDFMLDNTDPSLFCMELDVYWCQEAGYNPVEYLKKYAGRFPLLHIKDEEEIGRSGKMDFKAIFEAAYAQGMKEYFLEVERYNFTPMESVKKSFDYLASASYVK